MFGVLALSWHKARSKTGSCPKVLVTNPTSAKLSPGEPIEFQKSGGFSATHKLSSKSPARIGASQQVQMPNSSPLAHKTLSQVRFYHL